MSRRLSVAIRKALQDVEFWDVVCDESEARSGPFDGACLICAKAIIRASGRGDLVRIASDLFPAEHFGARIDEQIYDFNGEHANPEAWIRKFCSEEGVALSGRQVRFEEGYAQNSADNMVPDDPYAEKKVAAILEKYLAQPRPKRESDIGMGM